MSFSRRGRPTQAGRATLRERFKREAREFYTRHAIWTVRRMSAIKPAEREWRILLLTGPDDRSLTGIIMGDPRYLRSALYARRAGA